MGLVLVCGQPTLAQVPGALPGAVEPGRDRPLPEAPPTSNFDFRIQAPNRSPVPRAVDEIHFTLNDIRVVGAVTLSAERFKPLYQKLIGMDVTLADIFTVADGIEDEYRRAGYVLTRAFVPPQRVANGVFDIDVIEGFVATVSVEGGDASMRQGLAGYLQHVPESKPLDLATVERGLLLANDLPGIGATGVLRPSPDVQGASDLVVTASETPFAGGVALDNRGSHYTDVWTLTGDFAANSLFDTGDQLAATISSAPDPHERVAGQLRYRRPFGSEGVMGQLFATVTRGQPGSTLRGFNLLTGSWAVGPRLSYPILRSRAETLRVDAGITAQDARIHILGQPFSHDEWRVADIGVVYLRNNFLGGAWSANLDVAQGLAIAGATHDHSADLSRVGATTNFTKLVGIFRHTRTLAGPVSLALAVQGQFAFAPLIVGEQVTFGGAQFGRGYEPGAITGDHGLGGSLELRYDVPSEGSFFTAMQPYAFFDQGKVWALNSDSALNRSLSSAGGGIRVSFAGNIAASIELANTLIAVPGSDKGKKATKAFLDLAVRY